MGRPGITNDENKNDTKIPDSVPDRVFPPIFQIGNDLPTIAAKESPTDKIIIAQTAISIGKSSTVKR